LASNFPQNIDVITNPNSTDPLSNPSHSEQHIVANTAIEALEAKVGIDGSSDTNSLDYKVTETASQLEALAGAVQTLGGNTIEVLGLQGNNDLEVYAIENKTVIDTLDTNVWASAEYELKLTKNSDIYTSTIKAIFDGTLAHVTESNIVTNYTGHYDLGILSFDYNGSIINLSITPVSGSVSVRFYRTALKK
jgi:hypothetical protein